MKKFLHLRQHIMMVLFFFTKQGLVYKVFEFAYGDSFVKFSLKSLSNLGRRLPFDIRETTKQTMLGRRQTQLLFMVSQRVFIRILSDVIYPFSVKL